MNRFVVKAVEIDRVRAINGDSSAIDETGDRVDQAEILVLVIAAKGGRKKNQGNRRRLPKTSISNSRLKYGVHHLM